MSDTIKISLSARATKHLQNKHSKKTLRTAIARVNRGASLLDKHTPGWANSIAPDKLDLRDFEFCIVGQVFGTFSTDNLRLAGVDIDKHTASHYGFDIWGDANLEDYKLLDALWTLLVKNRVRTNKTVQVAQVTS